jgi:hypothetical protein
MATVYSVQQTLNRAAAANTGTSYNNGILDQGGKLRVAYANYVSTAVASGTVIELFTIPKNARILRGKVVSGALGSSVTLSVGTDVSLKDDLAVETTAAGVANCLAATAHASAAATDFAVTRLLGAGAKTSAATTFNLVTGGATLTADIAVHAWVEYLQN